RADQANKLVPCLLASTPAGSMNHIRRSLGIPRDSIRTKLALAGVIRSRPLATLELGLIRPSNRGSTIVALFVGLDVSLKTVKTIVRPL
ncbi:MAG: hypothetical protein AB7G08_32140, partial [Hyphomicrobiaceae bacterium]